MDYDSIRTSLGFINTHFKTQTKVHDLHKGMNTINSLLFTVQEEMQMYLVYDFHIRSNLSLFDTNSLNREIFNALQTEKNDEIKISLQGLLTVAIENIGLYPTLCRIKWGNEEPNAYYEGVRVNHIKPPHFEIKGYDDVWIANEDLAIKRGEYNFRYYSTGDFYDYCIKFRDLVNLQIGAWIEEKRLDNEIKQEKLKSLKRENKKFYLGLIIGGIITLVITLVSKIHF